MIGMEDTRRLNRKQHAEQTVLFNKLRSINQPFNYIHNVVCQQCNATLPA